MSTTLAVRRKDTPIPANENAINILHLANLSAKEPKSITEGINAMPETPATRPTSIKLPLRLIITKSGIRILASPTDTASGIRLNIHKDLAIKNHRHSVTSLNGEVNP